MTKLEKNKIRAAMRKVFDKYNRLAEQAVKEGDKDMEQAWEDRLAGAECLEKELLKALPEIAL